MKEKLKNFFKDPLKILLSLVVLAIVIGGLGLIFSSKSVRNFLTDKGKDAPNSSNNSSSQPNIPILGKAGEQGSKVVNTPAESPKTESPREGRLASGISVTRGSGESSKPQKVVTYKKPAQVFIETQASTTDLSTIEKTIRLSSEVVSIGRMRINGFEAIGYTTKRELKYNVAYIDKGLVYYLASKEFIPAN